MSPVQRIPDLTPVTVTANVRPVGKDKNRQQYRSPEKESETEEQPSALAEPAPDSSSPPSSSPAGSPDLDNPEKRGQIIDVKA